MYTGNLIADLVGLVDRTSNKKQTPAPAPIPRTWEATEDDIEIEVRMRTAGILTIDEVLSNAEKSGAAGDVE